MTYKIEIIRKEELCTSFWAGGTTTQLAIYPEDAIYSERNFKWRLSTAKVEVEESVFTSLPNINRIIMIVKGELILEHEGHPGCVLKEFDQHHFSGSWRTKSFGKVIDFNLMMREDCEGELGAIHLDVGQWRKISLDSRKGFEESVQAIYSINGQTVLKARNGDNTLVNKGDMILIQSESISGGQYFEIYNNEQKRIDLITAKVFF